MLEASKVNSAKTHGDSRNGFLFGAVGLVSAVFLTTFFLFFFDNRFWQSSADFYLLPWVIGTGIILLAPTAYLFYNHKFDLFHPLVHAAWAYWFPSFIVGGFLIAFGYIYPYQMTLLSDPNGDFKWTYIYISLGFLGMTAGFYLPWGKRIGVYLSRKLPAWDWQPRQVLLPAMVFLGVGLFFYVSAFISGVIGFSQINIQDSFAALNYTLSLLTLEAGFLVAMFIFKAKRISVEHILAIGIIGIILVSRLGLGGNRSSMLVIVTLLAMAFVYSGRKIKFKHGMIFGIVGVLAVFGGMIYGTTFRHIKGSEERVGFDQQVAAIEQTVDAIATQDTGKVLNEAFVNLAERIDGVSSVAVVVSNYERLKPYEASHGIENNVVTELSTMFIPRFIWKDKPIIYDARSYSDLYFNFSGNSYALTPIADLLRNFGPFGVPIGMLIVGIFLRLVYAMLIENQAVTIGRATAYYMFIASLSYEGFYTTIFIYGWRVLLIVFVTFWLAEFFLIGKKRA